MTESSRMFFVIAKMVPHFSFFFLLPFCRYAPTPPFAHWSRIHIFFSSESVCLNKINILWSWEGIKVWKNIPTLFWHYLENIETIFFKKKSSQKLSNLLIFESLGMTFKKYWVSLEIKSVGSCLNYCRLFSKYLDHFDSRSQCTKSGPLKKNGKHVTSRRAT